MKKPEITLTEAERHLLHRLYSADYAWTEQEVRQHLSRERFRQFAETELLTVTYTEIGPLVLLSAAGQRAVYGSLEYSGSTEWHINMAYTRLALQHLGWRRSTASEAVLRYDPQVLRGDHTEWPCALLRQGDREWLLAQAHRSCRTEAEKPGLAPRFHGHSGWAEREEGTAASREIRVFPEGSGGSSADHQRQYARPVPASRPPSGTACGGAISRGRGMENQSEVPRFPRTRFAHSAAGKERQGCCCSSEH